MPSVKDYIPNLPQVNNFEAINEATGSLAKILASKRQQEQQQQAAMAQEAEKQQNIAKNVELAHQQAKQMGLGPKQYSMQASESGVGINPENDDPLTSFLKAQQLKNLQDERTERAVTAGSKSLIESNLPKTTEAMQRLQDVSPGAIQQGQFKSVGGMKNLAPTFAIPMLEKMRIMPKGASEERAALQELQNVKLYDESGKAINESEMQRIKEAMGLRGVFDPKAIQQAIQQYGKTALTKSQTAEAGIRPEARDILKQRGAVSSSRLEELIKGKSAGAQQPMSFEEFKKAKREGRL